MIVIDTDVLSAFVRERPDPMIVRWLNTQDSRVIWTSAITVFEIMRGLSLMPFGERRRRLEFLFVDALSQILENRVLPFEQRAAEFASELSASRKLSGLNIALSDTLIAGIAIANGAAIATRNERHFSDLDIQVINPWREGSN